jgi:site-specific DNA recombinase
MLENIVEFCRKADGVTKNKILCCIFDGKLVLEKGRVAATPFSVPVQILLNITKGFHK